MKFKSLISPKAMFSCNGATRFCDKGIYETSDKDEIAFLKNNKMFVEVKSDKDVVTNYDDQEDEQINEKAESKGLINRILKR
jgi:hypothetical protein